MAMRCSKCGQLAPTNQFGTIVYHSKLTGSSVFEEDADELCEKGVPPDSEMNAAKPLREAPKFAGSSSDDQIVVGAIRALNGRADGPALAKKIMRELGCSMEYVNNLVDAAKKRGLVEWDGKSWRVR